MKRSMPGKGGTEHDIIQKMKRHKPWYMGDQVAKCIKHVRCSKNLRRSGIDECLLDSWTYTASQTGRNLKQEFKDDRAEDGWLRWYQNPNKQIWAAPFPVRIDWFAKVVARKNLGEYCCLEDVRKCLYRQNNVGKFILKRRPSQIENKFVDAYTDIEQAHFALKPLRPTERKRLINARLGQGEYRKSLFLVWKCCAVTGCKNKNLLRASHIKPWRECDNVKRMDKFNGLLLTPNLDHLFDKGLISFSEKGSILFSYKLKKSDALLLGVDKDMKLSKVEKQHKPYLAEHRRMHGFGTQTL